MRDFATFACYTVSRKREVQGFFKTPKDERGRGSVQ